MLAIIVLLDRAEMLPADQTGPWPKAKLFLVSADEAQAVPVFFIPK